MVTCSEPADRMFSPAAIVDSTQEMSVSVWGASHVFTNVSHAANASTAITIPTATSGLEVSFQRQTPTNAARRTGSPVAPCGRSHTAPTVHR